MKKQSWRRLLSLVMCMSLLISTLSVTAFADDQSEKDYGSNGIAEDGSYQPAAQAEDGCYEINNAGQLYWFAQLVNGYYNSKSDYKIGENRASARLTNDITVNDELNDDARKWVPMSNDSLPYMGTFDGNGYSISGLYFPGTETYTDENADHYAAAFVVYEENGAVRYNGSKNDTHGDVFVGLFGYVGKDGTVKNLTVKNSSFQNGYMDIGVIAGVNDGTVQNCTSESNTVSGNHSAGGIAGSNADMAEAHLKDCISSSHVTALAAGGGIAGSNYTRSIIENCTNNGAIDGGKDIGGIAGTNSHKISGCTNNGSVTSEADRAGGIAASMGNAEVINCTNNGAVLSKSDYAGGIAASTANSNTIQNCQNNGTVTADSTAAENCGYFVGGIVGAATKNTKVESCTNTGDVSAIGSVAGGIAGGVEGNSSVTRSSNSGTVTAKIYSGGIVGRMAYSGTGSSIDNCFNVGTVTTAENGYYAGGIAGQNGRSGYEDRGGSVKNCWNGGKVTAVGKYADYVGGIYGNVYGAGTIENCYYLDSSAAKTGINGQVTQPDAMESAQSADVFASGKITWYLNHKGSNTEIVWHQNVDNEQTQDSAPVLNADSGIVYACGANDETAAARYTNEAEQDHDTHDFRWSMTAAQHWKTCTRCGAVGTAEKHDYSDWKTIREATETVTGIEARTCKVCGMMEQRSVSKDQDEDKLPDASGDVVKSVEVADGAPETTLNTSKAALADSNILTEAEKNQVQTGEDARIWMTVNPLDNASVSDKDKTAIEAAAKQAAGENAKITYLDISLFKQVGTGTQEKISDVNVPLSITVTVPEEIRRAEDGMVRTFYVLRSHDAGELVPGTYDSTNGTFTFQSDKFSVYALAYADAPVTYPITMKDAKPEGGTISADRTDAAAGDEVIITAAPDKGYALKDLTVKDKDGNNIDLNDKGDGKYSFTMPNGEVNIQASFEKSSQWDNTTGECPKDDTCPIAPYKDSQPTEWYHDGVHFCLENKLMIGYEDKTFQPNTATSRAMITTILWRLEGEPKASYSMTFKDVADGQWYTEAVRWAQSAGVVKGYDADTFGANDTMTREQMMTVLYRYAQFKGIDVSAQSELTQFTDAARVSDWAQTAAKWAVSTGIVIGNKNNDVTLLDPQGSSTRAQAATMLMRYCTTILK